MNKEVVANAVKAQIGGKADVKFVEVRKNNKVLSGVVIGNGHISPTIYYDPELSDTEIIESIVRHYEAIDNDMPEFDPANLYDREYVLQRVTPQVVKREGNPYIWGKVITPLLDLAVLYRIWIDNNMSIVIPTPVLENADYTQEELHSAAVKNATKDARFCSMFSMISHLLEGDIEEDKGGMYVITNEEERYGAAVAFLVEPLLLKASKIFGDDVLILPSSIHECIVIPATGAIKEEVNSMVQMVNESQVKEEERLTDHAYLYHVATGKIEEFI